VICIGRKGNVQTSGSTTYEPGSGTLKRRLYPCGAGVTYASCVFPDGPVIRACTAFGGIGPAASVFNVTWAGCPTSSRMDERDRVRVEEQNQLGFRYINAHTNN
jgi:hypothetical protein